MGDRQEAAGGRRTTDDPAFAPGDLLVAASQGRHHHDQQLVQRLAVRGCLARSVTRTKVVSRAQRGIDKPIVVQYATWISGLAQGDLGYSYVSERPALEEIAPRIPITAKLAGLALCFSVLIGVPLGVISAVRQNSGTDYALRVLSLTGLSMPSFWLGLLILMAFVAYLDMIPIYTAPPKTWWDELLLLSVPAAAVGFRSSALMLRLTRSSMLEVLRQDYIRTARAKGASERSVNYHHALRNAVLPIVTI